MWARVLNGQLIEIIQRPKTIIVNDIQYPASIFTSAWTDIERKNIGIIPYVYEGSMIENMFYTSSESSPVVEENRVVVTRSNSTRDINTIKATMKTSINKVLLNTLSQTDWIIIREIDVGEDAPIDLARWRTDLRAKAVELEMEIDTKNSVSDLEAMTILTQEMIDAGKEESVFYNWPQNPRDT